MSQLDVGRCLELDKNTVSFVMRRLETLGLVDCGPDEWCLAGRVLVTGKGQRLLEAVRPELVAVAQAA